MSNNPKLQDMGEHAKQLLGFIQECKSDANFELLAEKLKQWKTVDKLRKKNDFIIHDDITVTHVQTGLMWKRKCEFHEYTYDEAAVNFKGNDKFAGYNGWRLPTIDELKTLLLFESPHSDTEAFLDNPSYVWSGSLYADDACYAWGVHFDRGRPDHYCRNRNKYNVRLVRGGQ